jgi:serine/threonine-protein kinase
MSPEQITSDTVDGRADLYSVGILLYRCAAGRFPYEADSPSELLLQIRDGKPTPIQDYAPELDREFASLVMKSIERDLDKRFQSAKDFQDALFAWAEGANRVENLLAEFLDRPGKSAPPKSGGAKPPRFTAKRLSFRQQASPPTGDLDEADEKENKDPKAAKDDKNVETTQPLPPLERAGAVAGADARRQTSSPPSSQSPSSQSPSSSDTAVAVASSAPPAAIQVKGRPSAQMRAIVLGAAIGALGAVILYAALFR